MEKLNCPYCNYLKDVEVNVGTSGTGSYVCDYCSMVVDYWLVQDSGKVVQLTKLSAKEGVELIMKSRRSNMAKASYTRSSIGNWQLKSWNIAKEGEEPNIRYRLVTENRNNLCSCLDGHESPNAARTCKQLLDKIKPYFPKE